MIQLTAEYVKAPVARAVPGAWYDQDSKAWVIDDPTPRAAAVALRLFPALGNAHPELVERRAELGQDVRPWDNASEYGQHIHAIHVRGELFQQGLDFYEFQSIDLGYTAAVLEEHGGAYLGWERGLGKTLGAAALIDQADCHRTLVVCPNTAKLSVWKPELERFCPWLEVVVLRNTESQRAKDLGYVQQLIQAKTPFALVVHYEALAIIGGYNKKGWDKLGEWDLIVADEAHRLANPKTQMSKALKRIPTKRKLAMSGSIIQNRPEELFGPLNWLFPKAYSSRWRDWSDRYLDYVDGGYSRVCVGVKIEKLAELRKELGVFMTYRTKSDELDLPPRTEQTLMVELSPAQQRVYNNLIEDCMHEFPDGTMLTAQDGLVLLTRLRQVATGLSTVNKEMSDSSKIDLAVELIEDSPDQAFVCFSWFKIPIHTLAERLEARGIKCFIVDGDTKHDERARSIAAFQAGEGRVFLGTLSTLGESVTLHRASNALFLDRSWNPSHNLQAADRIHRIGQDKPVTIQHIVARGTVDELRVAPVLADKEAVRKLILGG